MNRASLIVKQIVSDLIVEAESKKKHVLQVDTIRERAERHIKTKHKDASHEYLYTVGMTQVIYRWLNYFGFYAVRQGMFVNPMTCRNINYLNAIIENKETDVNGRKAALEAIREIRDPQISFITNGADIVGQTDPMTEDEFMEYLRADAV